MSIRNTLRVLAIALFSAVLTVPLAGAATARSAFPDRIDLPLGFLPEGITIGRGHIAYFGSRADGDIYAADLRTGEGRVISSGPGTPSIGLKADSRGRLFVAGGPSGTGRVVDVRSGDVLAEYELTTGTTFVNDVVLTESAAWFTDSQQGRLYGVPLAGDGSLPDPSDIITLPMTGDWVQQQGFNANGIASTPDKSALLVVQSNTGLLFRVDPVTGVATRVDLGTTFLFAGDGLLVLGKTLYAVQNQFNQVAVIELNKSGTSGALVDTLTSPDFDVPTTVASFGNALYLPNARFSTPQLPTTEFWATRIDRH